MTHKRTISVSELASKPTVDKNAHLNPPKSVQDVNASMKKMDDMYKGSFSEWLRDDSNIGWVVVNKKDLFEEYSKVDVNLVANAVCWLCELWSTEKTVEFLLKMFYSWGFEDSRLASIVGKYTAVHPRTERTIVSSLLVGERPHLVGAFLKNYLAGRSPSEKIKVVSDLAIDLAYDLPIVGELLSMLHEDQPKSAKSNMLTPDFQVLPATGRTLC